MNNYQPTGCTPFEKATVGRARANLLFSVHHAVKELVRELDECDKMISRYTVTALLHQSGKASKAEFEADLELATQALKDKKLFEEALVAITVTASQDLGLEA